MSNNSTVVQDRAIHVFDVQYIVTLKSSLRLLKVIGNGTLW